MKHLVLFYVIFWLKVDWVLYPGWVSEKEHLYPCMPAIAKTALVDEHIIYRAELVVS